MLLRRALPGPAMLLAPTLLLAPILLLALAACTPGEAVNAEGPAETPPPPVSVVTVEPQALPVTSDLPGRIAPTRIAEVRPRVSGIVVERVFEQGSVVEAGDVLYRIDPEPFRVQVASAEATLQRAKAAQLQARQQADRQKELRERNIASAQQMDNALALLAQADADVALAEAGLAQARLNLAYSDVRAPISGRIGRAIVTEGALVSANSAESLATIQQLDPVYADFTQSANELLKLRQALKVGTLVDPDTTPVELHFDDGSRYAHSGRLLFSEASVDVTTGQIALRGEFPNPDGDLLPGMYIRVVVEQGIQRAALAVPQQAVQRDSGGRALIYVVGADDTVGFRDVRLDRVVGEMFVVAEGIEAGERVVVEGFQKIRPGAVVAPVDWEKAKAQVSRAD
ncbi:MAG TPA: efflux RND transporter periplasmic adaptor subunit [Aquamicrobium sp.]|nr:efflux RND transporter periplasmic adaptor subunit [Aquamicrobium sp.]